MKVAKVDKAKVDAEIIRRSGIPVDVNRILMIDIQ